METKKEISVNHCCRQCFVKQELMSRLSINSRDDEQDGEFGIVHYLALDGVDTKIMHEYEDKCVSVVFNADLVSNIVLEDVRLLLNYKKDVVKFIEDNGFQVRS